MDVGMAVLTTLTDVREHHLHVTGSASHGRMHAAQGITRLVMVELGNRPDWLPAARGMAVLAGER